MSHAVIIGIGPYSKDIDDCMDREPDCYRNVPEGSPVLVHFFECYSKKEVAKLTELLNITDAYDVNSQIITLDTITPTDKEQLIQMFYEDDINQFLTLLGKGFTFIFDHHYLKHELTIEEL